MGGRNHLRRARRHARLGLPIPAESKHRLIKRIVLKLTWFTTSHQVDHNIAMVNAVTQLTNEVSALRDQITSHRHHVATVLAGVEASLRSEILGSDRRGELVEADLMRLSVATAALQERLDALVVNLATAADDAGASDTDATGSASTDPVIAEVRRLPGNRVT